MVVGAVTTRLYSQNASDWAQVPFRPFDGGNLFCVAHGNGTFVAGGEGYSLIMVSEDGVQWTGRMAVDPNGDYRESRWHGITFGNGRFVIVGASSFNIGTTSDPLRWYFRDSPTAATINQTEDVGI